MRRRSGLAILSSAFLAVMATACGSANETNSESKVYGGTKVKTGEWLSTVALVDSSGVFCTGTAVTPTLVISAGHCVSGTSASRLKIYVGDGKDGGYVTGQYSVKKIKASPKYTSRGNDISYIVLSTPLNLPADAYIPILTDDEEVSDLLSVGANAHIVGFGLRNGGIIGSKYEVDAKVVNRLSSMSHDSVSEIAIGGGGKNSCNGDSGGPVYGQLPNGEWRVYGVTSRGGSCGTGGIYGLMHANVCWIREDSGVDLNLPAGVCGDVAASADNDEVATPSIPSSDDDQVVENDDNTPSWWNILFGSSNS